LRAEDFDSKSNETRLKPHEGTDTRIASAKFSENNSQNMRRQFSSIRLCEKVLDDVKLPVIVIEKVPEFGDKLMRERGIFDMFEDFVLDLFVDEGSYFEAELLNEEECTFYWRVSKVSNPKYKMGSVTFGTCLDAICPAIRVSLYVIITQNKTLSNIKLIDKNLPQLYLCIIRI
jgi:hypothetical protein